MKDLVAIAEKIAAKLIERRQTIAIAGSVTDAQDGPLPTSARSRPRLR